MRNSLLRTATAVLLGWTVAAPAAAFDCSGNVTVTIRDGRIRIEGDDADNCITLYDDPSDAGFAVRSLEAGTSINQSRTISALIPIEEVRSVAIDLGKGNDRVEIVDVHGERSRWVVRGRDGDDFLALGRVKLDRLRLDGGKGDDTLILSQVSAHRGIVRGARGDADNLIAEDNTIARLTARGTEKQQPLTCPIAEDTATGRSLLGFDDEDVITCYVDKQLAGGEPHFVSWLTATIDGEEISYGVNFRTAAGIALGRPEAYGFFDVELTNLSRAQQLVHVGKYYDTPPYWLSAFTECQELLAQACPDHLNTFSDTGVVDIGPGSSMDDGEPI